MKFYKKRGYEGSIRGVWSDDKKVCYGLVGTVGDLLREGILNWCDYNPYVWVYIPDTAIQQKPCFGTTRDEALENLK